MMHDQRPIIYGDGEQSRDFTFVSNIVQGTILGAITSNVAGIAINCACHRQITLNYLVKKINEVLGKEIKPEYMPSQPGDIKHSFAAIEAAEKYLGYKPSILFDEGLKMTIDWHKRIKY